MKMKITLEVGLTTEKDLKLTETEIACLKTDVCYQCHQDLIYATFYRWNQASKTGNEFLMTSANKWFEIWRDAKMDAEIIPGTLE